MNRFRWASSVGGPSPLPPGARGVDDDGDGEVAEAGWSIKKDRVDGSE